MQRMRAWLSSPLPWIDLTITAAILLSWYGTMAGLAAVMSSGDAGEFGWLATLFPVLRLMDHTGFVIGLLFTTLVQGTMVVAAWQLVRSHAILGKAIWAGAFLAAALISIAFAYGTWFFTLEADRFAERRFDHSLRDVAQQVRRVGSAYDEMTAMLEAGAMHARLMADLETTKGGSCGDGVGRGPGDRFDKRQDDAARLAAFQRYFDNQGSLLHSVLASLDAAIGSFDANDAAMHKARVDRELSRASAILDDWRLGDIVTWANGRLGEERDGFFGEKEQRVIACRDPELRINLQTIATLVGALPSLPHELPDTFMPTARNAVQYAFDQQMTWLAGLVGMPGDWIGAAHGQPMAPVAASGSAGTSSIIPWTIAIFSDGMILLMSFARALFTGDLQQGFRLFPASKPADLSDWTSWNHAFGQLCPSATTALVERHLWSEGGVDRVVLPLLPPDPDLRALERLLRLLRGRRLAGKPVRMRASRLPPWWLDMNRHVVGGAEYVDVSRLRRGAFQKLIQMDLAQAASSNPPGP